MKSNMNSIKSSSTLPRKTDNLDYGVKKATKSASNKIKSRAKNQLDQELFEHHLLGFGPCG